MNNWNIDERSQDNKGIIEKNLEYTNSNNENTTPKCFDAPIENTDDEKILKRIISNETKITSCKSLLTPITSNTSEDERNKDPYIEQYMNVRKIVHPPLLPPLSKNQCMSLSNRNIITARKAVSEGTTRKYIIYTDGVFDMFHVGHMNIQKQAKYALGNPDNVHLIVGVTNDEDTIRYKGITVMDGKTRAESVSHCKWVDEVLEDAPWEITEEFIDKLKIDFVAHDEIPYAHGNKEDVYALPKRLGKFLSTQRTEGMSTTDIIVQIVRDYDAYVERNLSRGINKKEQNVGKTWEIRAVAHEKSKKLDASLDKMKAEKQLLAKKVRELLKEWRQETFSLTDCMSARKRKRIETNDISISDLDVKNIDTISSSDDMDTIIETSNNQEDMNISRKNGNSYTRLIREGGEIIKHTFRFTVALCETTLVALSYLNVYHYIKKCRQISQYSKTSTVPRVL